MTCFFPKCISGFKYRYYFGYLSKISGGGTKSWFEHCSKYFIFGTWYWLPFVQGFEWFYIILLIPNRNSTKNTLPMRGHHLKYKASHRGFDDYIWGWFSNESSIRLLFLFQSCNAQIFYYIIRFILYGIDMMWKYNWIKLFITFKV